MVMTLNKISHSEFVAFIASIYKPSVYLELGVGAGETMRKVVPFCKRAIGVDFNSEIVSKQTAKIYWETTNDFFSHFDEKVDMVFIDADHSFPQVQRDLINSCRLLNLGGVILMHDIDPKSDDLFRFNSCGDCYQIVELIEGGFLDINFNICTLPMGNTGLAILTRKGDTRVKRRVK